jgi:prephenate dehydrogenase
VCNIQEDSTLLLLAVNHYVLYLQIDGLKWRYRFASLAGRMENLIQENSRDMVDQAYMKLVGTMFTVLERIAQVDPKYVDVLLLENYAAFQNRFLSFASLLRHLSASQHHH